ncbi:MAG: M20/M25/M40 family metallo-hydrolase [Bacteroides sp.]|jgi:Zn-dependent M28 family amino/carboxypeptidase|nr:M20/M25/M40 family metallo-hydrolase [Bacteroides sp.]
MTKNVFPAFSWLMSGLITILFLISCQSNQNSGNEPFSNSYQQLVETLSSPEFEGRAPTTRGGRKTVAFIEEEFKRIGLLPANGDSYRQPVPLVEVTGENISPLVLSKAGEELSFSYPEEMIVGSSVLQDRIDLQESELVFAGYGIVAPEYGWNDYKNIDVTGKTVIVLVNDPGYELKDSTLFTGFAMTYYGRWGYKYAEAARQGAAAVLIVHETDPASYGWEVVRNSWSGPQYQVGGDGNGPEVLVKGWIQKSTAEQLFEKAGYTLQDLKTMALEAGFQPFSLEMTASVSFDQYYSQAECYNVAGYVKGSEYPDETILFMAHWDHLGKVEGPEGTAIYHGAVDNATGVASIIALAEKFAAMDPPPQRSVVFLAVTAEESGLIGSAYYAENPLFPLEKTVGGINIDAVNVYGPTHDLNVVGYNASQMQDYLEQYATEQNRVLKPESHPERGAFYRSDHFPLMRKGVPMLYAGSGRDYVDKDEAFAEWAEQDLRSRYHRPTDVITEHWVWEGIDENLWLYFKIGQELSTSRDWPRWREGSEFQPIREATEEMRSER